MATRVASSDRRVVEVLGAGRLLGEGGEASVHELDSEHVARIHRQGASLDRARERASLLAEIGRHATRVPFEIPSVVEIREVEGRLVSIEARLPGRAMGAVLAELRGEPRSALIAAYMEAAARVGDLEVDRPWFGELISAHPTRCPSFRSWLVDGCGLPGPRDHPRRGSRRPGRCRRVAHEPRARRTLPTRRALARGVLVRGRGARADPPLDATDPARFSIRLPARLPGALAAVGACREAER